MRPLRHICIVVALLAVHGLCWAGDAGADLYLFVASRSFDVTVAPVDEESKNAEKAILYQRSGINDEWESLGPCRRDVLANGDVRFTREVDVDLDGVYLYTSRPVVGGDVDEPPQIDDMAQATVVVDTLAPTVEILLPGEGFETRAGETVNVEWTIADEHLGDKPGVLSYSTDGGRSWNLVQRDLPRDGDLVWEAPLDMAGPAVLRMTAADRAGNAGRALRAVEVAVIEKQPPQPQPQEDTAKIKEPGTEDAPGTPVPTELVEVAREPEIPVRKLRDPNASWLYYLMALNQMKQNKPADALQYYWLAVKHDPEFINAWADLALAYNDLGAYQTAQDIVEQTMARAPERIDLLHLMGETYHAEGMEKLRKARDTEERMRAKSLVDQAVGWYGKALDKAAKEWRLAEQAPSYYRLGEICYYVNLDADGARAYWEKILSLHEPTPNSDLLKWSRSGDKEMERKRYERNTSRFVALHTWQNWARGYLDQMNSRERAGILDMATTGQRDDCFDPCAPPVASLSYSGNAINPGRQDGRSLFSLPGQLGSPDDVAACSATAGGYSSGRTGTGIGGANDINLPAHINQPPVTDGYSFYAEKGKRSRKQPAERGRRARSLLSGGVEPVQANPDPYAFPSGGRGQAEWNYARPYGNSPARTW